MEVGPGDLFHELIGEAGGLKQWLHSASSISPAGAMASLMSGWEPLENHLNMRVMASQPVWRAQPHEGPDACGFKHGRQLRIAGYLAEFRRLRTRLVVVGRSLPLRTAYCVCRTAAFV